jgi:hypothetical protein
MLSPFIRLKYSLKPLALEHRRHVFFLKAKEYILHITGRQIHLNSYF